METSVKEKKIVKEMTQTEKTVKTDKSVKHEGKTSFVIGIAKNTNIKNCASHSCNTKS